MHRVSRLSARVGYVSVHCVVLCCVVLCCLCCVLCVFVVLSVPHHLLISQLLKSNTLKGLKKALNAHHQSHSNCAASSTNERDIQLHIQLAALYNVTAFMLLCPHP